MNVDLKITGMTCASCSARVEKKLNKVPGVSAVVNLATERAHVEFPAELTNADLIAVVEKAGYGATVAKDDTLDTTESEARSNDFRRRFIVSVILSVPIIALSMIPAFQFTGWQWLVSALGIPVAFWGGWPFHKAAFSAGRHGASTMDTLVSLGVIASMAWSLWALLFGGAGHLGYTMSMSGLLSLDAHGHTHIYVESAAMIVTFLLLGRWLESRSRRHAGDALRLLLSTGAPSAHLVQRADGTPTNETIPAANLEVDDVFVVHAGQKIPTDGIVVSGSSAVDASLITGESTPIDATEGDRVIGATLVTNGSLRIRATRVGSDTTLAQMGKLLEQAQVGKAPIQRLADQIAAVFVPGVLLIALITLIARILLFDNSLDMALSSAITVLVVACPCALGLATPTALLVGSGRLSQFGILISGPEALENAHSLDAIALDKTGTLTTGELKMTDVVNHSSINTLAVLAGIETHSNHPLARALLASAQVRGIEPITVTDVREAAGRGLSARWNNEQIFAGSLAWLRENQAPVPELDEPGTIVACASRNEFYGYVVLRDTIRTDAIQTLTWLRDQGIEPMMVTGDNLASATDIAATLGITTVHANVLPEDKYALITELHKAGKKVAMVGDGINDAAALAAADLSIAMGSGTDVAQASADVTIVESRINAIPKMLRIGQKTLRIIKENLAWAFGYNLIAIPLAVFGIIAPGLAAIAMASSSVIVVANSLRLRNAR
ncbi:heavy metal translocating P-type ATPase [Arcanobacterium pinnipediorum]|uniref:Cation-translocating P-type ATPase n=1 Tax=Arcanobacterium pinnipediorum TaxID=1503041 RepID=A0ABY5AHN4_9ACTO|nr:cation-translocating P-type ATPase [Arcanobacterium pinnipediorum]USR79521.1 cation-translocating P-type ATPase [Arcanobacterium pinnipediorum]